MRKLATCDIFAALRVCSAIELKDELKNLTAAALKQMDDAEENARADRKNDIDPMEAKTKHEQNAALEVGISAILRMLELCSSPQAEARLYEFFAGPFEMQAQAVKLLDLDEFAEKITQLFQENDVRGFFTSLLKLTKKM